MEGKKKEELDNVILGVTLGRSLSPLLGPAAPSEVPVLKLIPGGNGQGKKHPGCVWL